LREFYDLEIAVIPPNRPCVRADEPDRLYPTAGEKEEAVVGQVADAHATGRPVLIGTLDVAESERLAARLDRAGLPCTVLNAKNDAQEAAIIAEAGARGAITVSTQMAGRGTDIRLGGTGGDRDLIAELGGLYVIGTGRHASSRLDQQLRGRAGRQGDPGGSVFFASMEDELVLQYAPGEARAGLPDARAHWVLGHAQRVAEGVNLEIHRNTWQYHKLIEDQRRIVLHQREQALRDDEALAALARRCPERLAELSPGIDRAILASAARQIVLFHLDRAWAEHLAFLADLREGIHLRALARGTVPLNEFNKEAIRAFNDLIEEAATRSAQSFRTAVITADGVDLEASGLKRPTATWTYLVHENPFGTDTDRALRSVARRIRKAGALGRDRSYRWMSYPREELAMCSGDRLVADFEAGAGTAPAVPGELREHLTVTADGLWVVWAYKLAAQRGGLFVPLRGDSGYPADARAECRARGARGGHRAPDPGCRCGFHALSDRSLPGLPVRGGFSALTVALSGRVLAYEWAGPGVLWRAERQTVVRVGRLALPGWPQEVPGARRRPDDPEGRMAVMPGAAPRDSGPVRLALPADCPVTVLCHDDAGWCTQPGTSRRRTSSLALV
jgi:hypothetical protein